MANWWLEEFGDPCRTCGYDWQTPVETALETVANAPQAYADILAGSDGSQRHPDLAWSAKAYVFHIADNLRIWAERVAASKAGSDRPIARYDDNLLAAARGYEQMPLEAAMWTLSTSVDTWMGIVSPALALDLTLDHSERGLLHIGDVVRSNCHDVVHHQWDIRRSA